MKRTLTNDIKDKIGKNIMVKGYIKNIRKFGGVTFLALNDLCGNLQLISNDEDKFNDVKKNDIVAVEGLIREDDRSKLGYEMLTNKIEVISTTSEKYPLSISPKSQYKLDKILKNRPLTIRNPKILDVFKVQGTIAQSFRGFLNDNYFKEIFTPKIVSQVAESGSDIFALDYFGNKLSLTQSPQIYKQIMVGSGLERVFEVGHVYRAEKHDTKRHLNEYVSLDIEMAFIDSYHDLMDLEEKMIRKIVGDVKEKHSDVLKNYSVEINLPEKIPRMPLHEVKKILRERYNHKIPDSKDIDPKGEKLVGKFSKEEYGSDFIFLTKYPKLSRPFYTKLCNKNPNLTDSFDFLMNGAEITTGGQRIHDYSILLDSMKDFGLNPEHYEDYLSAFKYGMPPHGGMGIGIERLTMKILNLDDIREASLFPRDKIRYKP